MTTTAQISRSLPAAKTEPAKSLAVPTGTGQAGGTSTRKSNFDSTGATLVKRGQSVVVPCCTGFVYGKVSRVRLGRVCVVNFMGVSAWVDCNVVKVQA
jgi:hypothetical protein